MNWSQERVSRRLTALDEMVRCDYYVTFWERSSIDGVSVVSPCVSLPSVVLELELDRGQEMKCP